MVSGANTLTYNLYVDTARIQIWGDGSAGTGVWSGSMNAVTVNRSRAQPQQTMVASLRGRMPRSGPTATPLPSRSTFRFIGAVPRTDWLPPEIERDAKAFVRTGPALAHSPHWTARRQPSLLETSRPGVFAAGDVRSGSIKRVASAVGEGAMAVQFVHGYLAET